jgi:hypothetical protein
MYTLLLLQVAAIQTREGTDCRVDCCERHRDIERVTQ